MLPFVAVEVAADPRAVNMQKIRVCPGCEQRTRMTDAASGQGPVPVLILRRETQQKSCQVHRKYRFAHAGLTGQH